MRPRWSFFVEGRPAPQGSKRLVRVRGGTRTLMLESSRHVKPWRETIGAVARMKGVPCLASDVEVNIVVRYEHPAAHYRANGELRGNTPPRPRYADCDKLCRAVCDALTGIAYRDDRQVAVLSIQRVWCRRGDPMGAYIEVIDLSDAEGI